MMGSHDMNDDRDRYLFYAALVGVGIIAALVVTKLASMF